MLARSDVFADGLAGTPLAAAKEGPLLLTAPDVLDPRVAAELGRVVGASRTVHPVGGPATISLGVEASLHARGLRTVRYAGTDRSRTALDIAARGLGDPDHVLLATGNDFADALSAGTAAASQRGAVLLTAGSVLTGAVAEYLTGHPPRRWAVGGPAARAVRSATPLVGADRFATSALVARTFFPAPSVAGLANGLHFPDGFSGEQRWLPWADRSC